MEIAADEEICNVEAFKQKFPEGTTIDDGTCVWMSSTAEGVDNGSLWCAAPEHQDLAIPKNRELFSFGSGGWEEGAAAEELMKFVEGPWISFQVDGETPVLIEKGDGLPEHVLGFEYVVQGSVVPLEQVLVDLETHGDTKLTVTAHSIERGSATHIIRQDSYVCFKMELKALNPVEFHISYRMPTCMVNETSACNCAVPSHYNSVSSSILQRIEIERTRLSSYDIARRSGAARDVGSVSRGSS